MPLYSQQFNRTPPAEKPAAVLRGDWPSGEALLRCLPPPQPLTPEQVKHIKELDAHLYAVVKALNEAVEMQAAIVAALLYGEAPDRT